MSDYPRTLGRLEKARAALRADLDRHRNALAELNAEAAARRTQLEETWEALADLDRAVERLEAASAPEPIKYTGHGCPACRMGLVTHDTADPQCDNRESGDSPTGAER